MKLKEFFNLFKPDTSEIKIPKEIKDLDILDDVWVKENDITYKGWVFDKSRKHLTICYNVDKDYKFRLSKPLTATEITQDNKILYCNEPKNNS